MDWGPRIIGSDDEQSYQLENPTCGGASALGGVSWSLCRKWKEPNRAPVCVVTIARPEFQLRISTDQHHCQSTDVIGISAPRGAVRPVRVNRAIVGGDGVALYVQPDTTFSLPK